MDSISERTFVSGLGKILKVTVACDADLFTELENNAGEFKTRNFVLDKNLGKILFGAIDATLNQLAPNIYEHNLQRSLDLGHTFSQAFEMATADCLHGGAVALDITLSAIIAMSRGMLSRKDTYRIARLSERLGLPMIIPRVDFSAVWDSVLDRVSHRGGRQNMPIPLCLGKCIFIDDLKQSELANALEEFTRKPWHNKD